MPATARGVYHNLKESEYVVSNTEITLFFSSEVIRSKFMEGYESYRERMNQRLTKAIGETTFNMNTLFDLQFYEVVEKRGCYVLMDGVNMTWYDLHQYALRNMTVKSTLNWQKVQKPKLIERLRSMDEKAKRLSKI